MEDPILNVFLEEADERLAELEEDLIRLEQSPSDTEIINRIFRCAHTLKGNSKMLGFDDIARFTHSLEDLLDQLRKQERLVTPDIVDTLLMSGDVLKDLVGVARGTTASAPDVTDGVLKTIQALLRGEDTSAGKSVLPPTSSRSATSKSPAAAPTPPASATTPQPSALAAAPVAAAPADDFFGLFEPAEPRKSTPDTQAPPVSAPGAATGTQAAAPIHDDLHMTSSATNEHGRHAQRAGGQTETSSIRVPVEKVDRLINLVGELVITQSIVAQTIESFTPDKLATLQEAVSQMDRHARELHERMMAVRMVPIRSLFARFPRLVRDLSSMTGKQVVLETEGEDTELDKTVMERITDPLTHLLRNALDHGVETPAERTRLGKSGEAAVALRAYQRGGSVFIEVEDDGKGIDCERIKAKAIQSGLISADTNWTQDQVVQLIFKPGLSTAEKVTEVSGRGVGMDVVKRNIESLGGTISIKTEKGRGTLFQIKLPLTLAIMDGQALRVGDQIFVVPLIAITESVRPASGSIHHPAEGPALVVIRERALPIVALHEIFDVEPQSVDPLKGLLVIVESDGQLAGLLVDELLGQQQVVVKNLETHFRKVEGVSGATILGDGRVALILDVAGLLALARTRSKSVVL